MRKRILNVMSALTVGLCIVLVVFGIRSVWVGDQWSIEFSTYKELGEVEYEERLNSRVLRIYTARGGLSLRVSSLRVIQRSLEQSELMRLHVQPGVHFSHTSVGVPSYPYDGTRPYLREIGNDWRFLGFQYSHIWSQDADLAGIAGRRNITIPIPVLVLLAGPLPLWRLRLFWRQRRASMLGLCQSCGYDLRGNVSGICPECGTAIPTAEKGLKR